METNNDKKQNKNGEKSLKYFFELWQSEVKKRNGEVKMENKMTEERLKEIEKRSGQAKEVWSRMPLCPPEGDSFWFAEKLIYEDVPALLEEINRLKKGEKK